MNTVDLEDLEHLITRLSQNPSGLLPQAATEELRAVMDDVTAGKRFDRARYLSAFETLHKAISGKLGTVPPLSAEESETMQTGNSGSKENFIPAAQAESTLRSSWTLLKKALGIKPTSVQKGGLK